jgi:hypothetical protein
MKKDTQIALAVIVLLALAALSSVKRGAAPKGSGGNRGACCPLIQSLNQMSLSAGTNAPVPVVSTNKQSAINHL